MQKLYKVFRASLKSPVLLRIPKNYITNKLPDDTIDESEKQNFMKTFETMNRIIDSDLHKVIYANKAAEIIKVVNEGNIKSGEDIRFTLFYLSSYEFSTENLDVVEVSKCINFFMDNFKDICNENENLVYFLHAITKLQDSVNASLDTDKIFKNLMQDTPYIIYDIYEIKDLINLANYTGRLFRFETMLFIDYFEKNLKPQILKKISQLDLKDSVILIKLMSDMNYLDSQVIDKIISKAQTFDVDDKKTHLQLLYIMNQLGYKNPDFFKDIINKLLHAHILRYKESEGLQRQTEIETRLNEIESEFAEAERISDALEYQTKKRVLEIEKKDLNKEFDDLIEVRALEDNLAISDYIEMLNMVIEYFPEDSRLFKEILGRLFLKRSQIVKDTYIDLWLTIAFATKRGVSFIKDPIINELKSLGTKLISLSIKNYEASEIIKVFISMASIKVDDKNFASLVIVSLLNKIDKLNNTELIQLFRSFFVYSNMFEDFYLKIHDEILRRLTTYKYEELSAIKDVLVLKKDLFEDSPLMKLLNIR